MRTYCAYLSLKLVLAEAQLAVAKIGPAQQTARSVLKKAETSVRAMRLLSPWSKALEVTENVLDAKKTALVLLRGFRADQIELELQNEELRRAGLDGWLLGNCWFP